jgi:hypothetical protein
LPRSGRCGSSSPIAFNGVKRPFCAIFPAFPAVYAAVRVIATGVWVIAPAV